MPKVTVGVMVPVSIEVDVHDGEQISDAVERAIQNGNFDIDGEIEPYSVNCDDCDDVDFDSTLYTCVNCDKVQTDEMENDLCEACREEE